MICELIDQAYHDRRAVAIREVPWTTPSGESCWLDIKAVPLLDSVGAILGVNLTFTDVTRHKLLEEELQRANEELETVYEELQATNEELETTNEELQSTSEELETTNEELQSTNEELVTMNEELQSTNEELQTINEELNRRSAQLNQLNAFLESILTSLRCGIVVVDRDLRVQVWNRHAEDLWGLRAEEVVGQHFLNLDIGLPVDRLRPALRACLVGESGYQDVTLEATTRRGRSIQCRVTCTPLIGPGRVIEGVIVMMEEQDR